MAKSNKEAPRMVVVDGVRYRPEDAPKERRGGKVSNKMRTPAANAAEGKQEADATPDAEAKTQRRGKQGRN